MIHEHLDWLKAERVFQRTSYEDEIKIAALFQTISEALNGIRNSINEFQPQSTWVEGEFVSEERLRDPRRRVPLNIREAVGNMMREILTKQIEPDIQLMSNYISHIEDCWTPSGLVSSSSLRSQQPPGGGGHF